MVLSQRISFDLLKAFDFIDKRDCLRHSKEIKAHGADSQIY